MPQDDQFAISCGKGAHHGFDFRAPFLLLAFLLGREPQTLQRDFTALGISAGDQRLPAHGVTPQMIDSCVVGDFVYPGRKLEFRAIAPQRVVNLDKDFLGQVERRVVIANHAIDVSGDGSLIAAYQLFKTGFAASKRALNQLAVGSRTPGCN